MQKSIIKQFKLLACSPLITIEVSDDLQWVDIIHSKLNGQTIRFHWDEDHYTGWHRSTNRSGKVSETNSMFSISGPTSAAVFVSGYMTLAQLRPYDFNRVKG